MKKELVAAALGSVLSVGLTGCFKTVKLVPQTVAPSMYRSASLETLSQRLSDRNAALKTLNASVLITASTGGGRTGKVTTYTSFKGYIFVRKPYDLRVLMLLPVLGSKALDMVSDKDNFTLMRASTHGNVWMQGANKVTKPSKNGLENLRPPVFFDSLLVPGLGPDESATVVEAQRLVPIEGKKRQMMEEPDYDMTIMGRGEGKTLPTRRVVHINRVDMLPIEQDIYDDQARLVTKATYENYKEVNGQMFPMTITISRPLDEYSLKIDITKLTLNGELEDDQFELKIPAGVTVQKME